MRARSVVLIAFLSGLSVAPAQAQSCRVNASPIQFGNVSPIRLGTVDASGSVSVTCTWPLISASRNARVCLNLAGGTGGIVRPRYLVKGGNRMEFDLYTDAARSQVWGTSLFLTAGVPITFVLSKPFFGTTATRSEPYYGRILANQPTVPLVGGSSTIYSKTFAGLDAVMTARFFDAVDLDCPFITEVRSGYSLEAQARVVNDCTITATDLNFPTTGVLSTSLLGTGGLNVRCTNGSAWRLTLDGGGSGNVLDRKMRRSGSAETIRYQLYTDPARRTVWGDGSQGTATVTGAASGQGQRVVVHGAVPAQPTPSPGAYQDVITATINF